MVAQTEPNTCGIFLQDVRIAKLPEKFCLLRQLLDCKAELFCHRIIPHPVRLLCIFCFLAHLIKYIGRRYILGILLCPRKIFSKRLLHLLRILLHRLRKFSQRLPIRCLEFSISVRISCAGVTLSSSSSDKPRALEFA